MTPSEDLPDYYAILCIQQSADSATIKSQYKKLALERHPDRCRHDPNATANFQRLNEAHETLCDTDKRRRYDERYQVVILPRQIENQRILSLDRKLQQFKAQRLILQTSRHNVQKDLHRLYAERDSIKGEKDCLVMEKALKEGWWPYACAMLWGKAGDFARQKHRRECAMVTAIGKQRTKEIEINGKKKEGRILEERILAIVSEEDRIKIELRQIARTRALARKHAEWDGNMAWTY